MYAVMGITGQVGKAVTESLLALGKQVRAVVRDPAKAESWARQGVEVVAGDTQDVDALVRAFQGVEGVFAMIPGNFAPSPGFPEPRALISALREALARAAPPRVVALSSVGAQHDHGLGLITALHVLEKELSTLPVPIAFLRPAWFMENAGWDVAPARRTGVIDSFVDRAIPMIATADIGRLAAGTLTQPWTGKRLLELEGPGLVGPKDIAAGLGRALNKSVDARQVPRGQWEAMFKAQGTAWPEPRLQMLDGFNTGWIDFERSANTEQHRGRTFFDELALKLV
jgi:NAD(P)H dehydrogenase (quinone)